MDVQRVPAEQGAMPAPFAVPVLVINLERSRDRRDHMQRELAEVGVAYEVVEAVDARELDLGDRSLVSGELAIGPGGLRPGAVGAALSHLRAYQRALETGSGAAVVLEDDLLLPGDLAALSRAVALQMSGAEVVLLNFHCVGPAKVQRAGSVDLGRGRSLVTLSSLQGVTSGGAYVLTLEASRRLAGLVLPVRGHADDWERFVAAGALDRVRCVVPMQVANSTRFRTTIDYFPLGSPQWRLRERLARSRVPLLQRALARRRVSEFAKRGWSGAFVYVD